MEILVLNANRKEREALCEHLAKKGVTSTAANGGFHMLEDMDNFKKDLVLLDYQTWRQNRGPYRYFGVERAWAGIPVVAIGANENSEVFTTRHDHEQDARVPRPIDFEKLDEVLDPLIQKG